jgi:PEP-CTERM motif
VKRFLCGIALTAVALLLGSAAKADDLQIHCTGLTVCAPGGIETTGGPAPLTFNLALANGKYIGGELWLAIIIPDGGTGIGSTFTVNGNPSNLGVAFTGPANNTLWEALGVSEKLPDHNYASTESFSPSLNGYTAYDILLTSNFNAAFGVTVSPTIDGTLFVGFTEDGKKSLATPWSESLEFVGNGPPPPQVPEPASLMLLGSGLLALGGMVRRKLS